MEEWKEYFIELLGSRSGSREKREGKRERTGRNETGERGNEESNYRAEGR